MTLMLPETPGEYALEMPEIFSACKVYLNGKLLPQLGDPSPESFREGLQSRVLCFTGSGKTELLIAAADHSGICRGMTSPPAFGTAEVVLRVRELRLLLHGGLVLLALLGAAMICATICGPSGAWRSRSNGTGWSSICRNMSPTWTGAL